MSSSDQLFSKKRTTISVFTDTKEILDLLGAKNESYDEIINHLIINDCVMKDRIKALQNSIGFLRSQKTRGGRIE